MPDSSPTEVATSKQLVKSTTVVASLTGISRVLGFVRDMLIAHLFGAVAGVDAFFVAFKIPNFMRRLFAEGAFSQAFVPVLSQYRATKSTADVRQFISHMTGNLGLVLAIINGLAILAAPILILLFAPGFKHDAIRFSFSVHMIKITFGYLFFISLTALAGAVLNTYRHFAAPAITPVLLNISLIVCAIWLAPHLQHPVYALAWGVLAAGLLQFLFQLPFLWRYRLLVKPRINWHDTGVRRVLILMVPALFGVSVAQINLLLDTVFASFLPVGSVAWLYYSDRLMNFPLGVFGVAISTVILPQLAQHNAEKTEQAFVNTLNWALRTILLISLPAALGLIALAGPVLVTLFNYGRFNEFDVLMTQRSLLMFALGIPAFMLIKTLASAFYAKQNIKTPVKIAALAMVLNIILNFALIHSLAHAGLALATSLSALLNAGLLFYKLRQQSQLSLPRGWSKFWWQVIIANSVMGIWLYLATPNLSSWFYWPWQQRALHLGLLLIGAVLSYGLTLRLLGLRLLQVLQRT